MAKFLDGNVGFMISLCLASVIIILGAVIYKRTKDIGAFQGYHQLYSFENPDGMIASRVSRKLEGAVNIPTVCGSDSSVFADFKEYLRRQFPLTFLKFERENVGDSFILKFEQNGSDKRKAILFLSHMDTSHGQIVEQSDSSVNKASNQYVFGKGTLSGKGTMICLLEAIETLLEKSFAPKRDIYLAFTHDKEGYTHEGAKTISQIFKKRDIDLQLVFDEGTCIIEGFMGNKSCACACVSTAQKGFMTLELEAKQHGAHTSYAKRNTALGRISEAICRIETIFLKGRINKTTVIYLKNIAPILSYRYRMMIANKFLFRSSLLRCMRREQRFRSDVTNVFAAVDVNSGYKNRVLPENTRAVIEVSFLPGVSYTDVLEHVKRVVKPLGIDVYATHHDSAVELPNFSSNMFNEIESSLKKRYGNSLVVTPCIQSIYSDAVYFEKICDNILRFSPIVLKECIINEKYTQNERVPIRSLAAQTEFYIEFIDKIAR